MSLELHPNDLTQVQSLWKSWETGTDVELEASFKSQDLTTWIQTVQHLRSLGLQESAQPTRLNIMVPGGLRFTLVGDGIIEEFCKDNTILGKPFHVILKERRRGASGGETEADWKDYDVRIKLRRELPLSMEDVRVRDVLQRWATIPKTFRYIRRFSFTSKQFVGLQFDLSMVRSSRRGPRGEYAPSTSFQAAEIPKQPIQYEMEVEVSRGAVLKTLILGIATVLRGIQRSFVPTRNSVRKQVLDFVAHQTRAAVGAFPGPQPATLERVNMDGSSGAGTADLRTGDYNVTDKADGQRCLLVVMKTGGVFLVDTNMTVFGTDLKMPRDSGWAGAILDGEWVRTDAADKPCSRYYAFDIYNGREGRDVCPLPFMSRGAAAAETNTASSSRFAELSDATAALASVGIRTVATIPKHASLSVHMKTFQTPLNPKDPQGIFREAASMLDRLATDAPYHTDGLIFTPNAAPLPKNQGTWAAQLKWKPAAENSIDFLVVTEKERDIEGKPTDVALVSTKLREDTNQAVRFKTLRLCVGSRSDPALLHPRETILNEKDLPQSLEEGDYRPVEFSPGGDPMASVCYVAIDAAESEATGDDMVRCVRSGDPIQNHYIVEMSYHPERAPGWRWEPMRVRWDKTERFQRGIMGRTMNADWVANSIWASIHAPVTESMIRTGATEEGDGTATTTTTTMTTTTTDLNAAAYYVRKAPARDLHKVRGLRQFHNQYVKEDILLGRVLKKGVALYDMTCGQAGDIHKWIRAQVGWVFGTDLAEKNLTDARDGAYRRYLDQVVKAKGAEGAVPPMLFVQANTAARLADGGAGQTQMDRAILRTLWSAGAGGAPEPECPPYATKFRGKGAEGFDVVSCMFSLHYFFKDRATLDGWLRNLSDTLRVGGHFVGCCFDGEAVAALLADVPQDGTHRGVEGGVDVWSITKRYEGATLAGGPDSLGRAIDVSFISIGEMYTEYLVSWAYLQERLAAIGLELLNADELAALGLQHSTNMFGASYDMAAAVGRNFPMSAVLRQFSFLNRWFIFKRRSMGAELPEAAPGMAVAATEEERVEAAGPVGPTGKAPTREVLVEEDVLPNIAPADAPYLEVSEESEQPDVEEVTEDMIPSFKNVDEEVEEAEMAAAAKAEEDAEEEEEEEEAEANLQKANGPIFHFYQKGELKDDLGLKDKAWRRWLATYALSPLKDWRDPAIVYPSMEAALTAAKYQIASNKPELGPKLFGETGAIHQKYAAIRMEKGGLTDKEEQALMEDEGDDMRKAARPAEIKKTGAKFDEAAWKAGLAGVIDAYVGQRYETDTRFRRIMDALKERRAHLVFYTTPSGNEFSGRINEDDEIEGENMLGRGYMRKLGLYY